MLLTLCQKGVDSALRSFLRLESVLLFFCFIFKGVSNILSISFTDTKILGIKILETRHNIMQSSFISFIKLVFVTGMLYWIVLQWTALSFFWPVGGHMNIFYLCDIYKCMGTLENKFWQKGKLKKWNYCSTFSVLKQSSTLQKHGWYWHVTAPTSTGNVRPVWLPVDLQQKTSCRTLG